MSARWRHAIAPLAMAIVAGCVPSVTLPDDCAEPGVGRHLVVSADAVEPQAVAVCIGQQVTIHIDSEEAGELHVHGYEDQGAEVELIPGETASLELEAVRSGQFPMELHLPDATAVEVGLFTVHEP